MEKTNFDQFKMGDKLKDFFLDLYIKGIEKIGNSYYYHVEDEKRKITEVEFNYYRRVLDRICGTMDETKDEKPEEVFKRKNLKSNIGFLYYYTEICKKNSQEMLDKLNDFFENLDEKKSGSSSKFIMKYFQDEVKSHTETRIKDAINFVQYGMKKGFVNLDDLIDNKFFNYITVSDIINLQKEGALTRDDVRTVFIGDTGIEEKVDDYKKLIVEYIEKIKNLKNNKIKHAFLELFNEDESYKVLLSKSFNDEDLKRLKFSKKDFLKLDTYEMIKLKDSRYCYDIKFDEMFDLYGEKFNIDDIINLSRNGLINPEDIISLTHKKLVIDENEDRKKILKFYDVEQLLNLRKGNKINNRFREEFKKELLEKVDPKDIKNYEENLISDVKKLHKDDINYSENIIWLNKNEFLSSKALKETNLDIDNIFQLYLDNKLENQDMFRLYNFGILNQKNIEELYSVQEIFEFYTEGILDSSVLNIIKNEDLYILLADSVETGKIGVKELVDLYENDVIKTNEFCDILKDSKSSEDISDYISVDTDKNKIYELYKNFAISDDEITRLLNRGIIDKESYDNIRKSLAKSEFFKKLEKTKEVFIMGEDNETPKMSHTQKSSRLNIASENSSKRKEKISPDIISEFYDEIGGMKQRPKITGSTSLNGYSIIGFPKYELVILENFEKTGNATYIMSFQQLLFYQNNNYKTSYDFNIANKNILRKNEKIRVNNHTSGFGENIIISMKSLSDDVKKDFSNREYKKKIKESIEIIKDDYNTNKKER